LPWRRVQRSTRAVALEQADIEDFVVLARADGLGGTWRDDRNRGVCCDMPFPEDNCG